MTDDALSLVLSVIGALAGVVVIAFGLAAWVGRLRASRVAEGDRARYWTALQPLNNETPQPWTILVLTGLLAVLGTQNLAAQASATIDINTANSTPIQPKFSGANHEIGYPVEFWDPRFNTLAAKVGYGWLRFPGGNDSDAYSWQAGEEVAAWAAQFSADALGTRLPDTVKNVAGKGGARLIDAANQANLLGASLIMCVNGFTDTSASAGQLAAYVKANQIAVVAWELSNEAYLFPDFFPTSTDYLDKMKPYRDAIKAVDSNAIVAIFINDPGQGTQTPWNQAVAAYPNKYWDAITFHHYPPTVNQTFAQAMADDSAQLANNTIILVTSRLLPLGSPGTRFIITEFDPSLPVDHTTGITSITDGTLWGGVYVAEFIMRMSTVPAVLYAGPHAIDQFSGVDSTDNHYGDVRAAADAGKPIDTSSLDFGFYLSAQANGLAVVNSVVNRAVQVNETIVTGGATVAATGVTGGVPALYATSYTTATGGLSVVITNKSATPHDVTIRVNGTEAAGTFPLQYITGTDPSAQNSLTSPNTVAVQTSRSTNPVTVPPYCVMRVDLVVPPRHRATRH